MALEGLLKDVCLANVIAVITRGHKTGALTLIDGDRDGIIYITEGVPVHAVLEERSGDEALNVLLGWSSGRFVFEEHLLSGMKTVGEEAQARFSAGQGPTRTAVLDDEDSEDPGQRDGLFSIFSRILEHSTLGISAVALASPERGELLAYSSILDKNREAVASLLNLLDAIRRSCAELGRGAPEQTMILDREGWFIASRVNENLYLLCLASSRAKLGQLLFHLKKVQCWVGGSGLDARGML